MHIVRAILMLFFACSAGWAATEAQSLCDLEVFCQVNRLKIGVEIIEGGKLFQLPNGLPANATPDPIAVIAAALSEDFNIMPVGQTAEGQMNRAVIFDWRLPDQVAYPMDQKLNLDCTGTCYGNFFTRNIFEPYKFQLGNVGKGSIKFAGFVSELHNIKMPTFLNWGNMVYTYSGEHTIRQHLLSSADGSHANVVYISRFEPDFTKTTLLFMGPQRSVLNTNMLASKDTALVWPPRGICLIPNTNDPVERQNAILEDLKADELYSTMVAEFHFSRTKLINYPYQGLSEKEISTNQFLGIGCFSIEKKKYIADALSTAGVAHEIVESSIYFLDGEFNYCFVKVSNQSFLGALTVLNGLHQATPDLGIPILKVEK
jgi:hypothetical protein